MARRAAAAALARRGELQRHRRRQRARANPRRTTPPPRQGSRRQPSPRPPREAAADAGASLRRRKGSSGGSSPTPDLILSRAMRWRRGPWLRASPSSAGALPQDVVQALVESPVGSETVHSAGEPEIMSAALDLDEAPAASGGDAGAQQESVPEPMSLLLVGAGPFRRHCPSAPGRARADAARHRLSAGERVIGRRRPRITRSYTDPGPEWRNWQTQETQNLPPVTRRVGSIPSSGTTLSCVWQTQETPVSLSPVTRRVGSIPSSGTISIPSVSVFGLRSSVPPRTT